MAFKKRVRVNQFIAQYLSDGPKDTRHIYENLNHDDHNGLTMCELANLLSRSPAYKKLGLNRFRVSIWALREWFD